MADSNDIVAFLLEGRLEHRFPLLGKEVVLDLFAVGTREQVERQVSGLDATARRVSKDVLDLAYSLRSLGGFDFACSLDEKLKFVRGMSDPVFELFVEELRLAQIRQRENFAKRRDELKKSSPNPG